VDGQPDGAAVLGSEKLRQGYLAIDGAVEIRLRETDGRTVMTVKAGSGLDRTEVEVALDDDGAADLWPHASARSLEKVRSRIRLDDELTAELDVYEGALAGLRVVEVEFVDLDAADAFSPPAWFGRELTGERGWSNAELATDGSPVPLQD
jgi:CYTH domain-containing protein